MTDGSSVAVLRAGALRAIDALVCGEPSQPLLVRGSAEELAAVGRHVARRAGVESRSCLVFDGRVLDEPWRAACAALSVDITRDHEQLAARLVRASAAVVLVILEVSPSYWGGALVEALARLHDCEGRLIVLTPRLLGHQPHFLLNAPADSDDSARYFRALVEASRPGWASRGRLHALEQWWHQQSAEQAPHQVLTKEAVALRARLTLARRCVSRDLMNKLGTRAAWEQLTATGELSWFHDHGWLSCAVSCAAACEGQDERQVAVTLQEHARDCWGLMRAAELCALSGDGKEARQAADEALRLADDSLLRADLWERFDACLGAQLNDAELAHYGTLALQYGNLQQARQLAQRAGESESFAVKLMAGRVLRRCGDSSGSQQNFKAALALAPKESDQAIAHAEMAELLVRGGRCEQACRCAEKAIALTKDVKVELLARNAAGKTLLVCGSWAEAIAHFHRDEDYAMRLGREEDALRARVNRAVAKMSLGHVVEARALLESILSAGERLNVRRARVFAHANLASLAALVHDYTEAIEFTLASIEELGGSGDTTHTARQLVNLAELRLAVGLLDEGEQALALGRQACGPSVGDALITFISLVSAKFQLARGRTLHAAVVADEAIAAARRCGDMSKLAITSHLAARIALEDGDLHRGRRHVAVAAEAATAPALQAESAILQAEIARASGEPFAAAAGSALALAEEVDDIDLRRQAHCLCFQAARAEGQIDVVEQHLRAACSLRDRLAAALPPSVQSAFLRRADLRPLAAMERSWLVEVEPASRTVSRHRRKTPQPQQQLIGESAPMRALRSAARRVGRSDATVLVFGESGTGKELIADAIHRNSPRRDGPLVKVNCAALVETLLLSELFGHEKGSFTGAHARRQGRFEQAHRGTIFLDEIGDIPPQTQVALLRVLQERSFERVGGTSTIDVDVRVVCATHRDLNKMVKQGTFREDLYYRLCGVVMDVPPLRRRLDDLPLLCNALLQRVAQDHGDAAKAVSEAALVGLARHSWPGNIRELDNALRAAALFAENQTIELSDLTGNVAGLAHLDEDQDEREPAASVAAAAEPESLIYAQVRDGVSLPVMKRALERACIERALAEAGGNITRAAKLLGMKRPRLSQLVHQFAGERRAAQL